jgi:hypothetical protein
MFEELSSKDPKVKYSASKALLATARSDPSSLYAQADYFVGLLDGDNDILKWTAIDIMGCLARVDTDKRVSALTDRLSSFLSAGKLITANHAISALSEFAVAYPDRRDSIAGELMNVEHCTYDTDECRNIALGKVIEALSPVFNALRDKKAVLEFAERQTHNTRNATAKKAHAFLKKHAG